MADDKDMGQDQGYSAEEGQNGDDSLTGGPQQVTWTRKDKIRAAIEMIIALAVIAVSVKYGVKYFTPFIQSLFRPITMEDLWPEDNDNSKREMYEHGGSYVFEYEDALCRVPTP